MIRYALISAVMAAGTAGAATGQPVEGGPEWLSARSAVFSDVCMAAAPDFSEFDALAEKAGLDKVDQGWLLPPEAVVMLLEHDGFCSCFMTVRAPDQAAMIKTVFDRLMQDWGTSFTGKPEGWATVAPFQRDGQEAVSIMEKREFDAEPWIEARVSVFGTCPSEGGGQ